MHEPRQPFIATTPHGPSGDGAAHGSVRSYVTGFLLSVLLTAVPFALVMSGVAPAATIVPVCIGLAVAQILAYVFRLKQAIAIGDLPPDLPEQDIDPELLGPYRMDN